MYPLLTVYTNLSIIVPKEEIMSLLRLTKGGMIKFIRLLIEVLVKGVGGEITLNVDSLVIH